MNIDAYTFEEFRQLAENFHSYAAPGLLLGGYMVALAKSRMPEGTLYEALVETRKCLPDAVQLLTPCSTGNNWMKVVNLGRYAVSLYDKHTGEGVRVSLSSKALRQYPEIYAWFMKTKTKAEQDSRQLEKEIREAGASLCLVEPIRIKKRFLGKHPMQAIDFCPMCDEAYPTADGSICRGCQGEQPYNSLAGDKVPAPVHQHIVPVEKAVGMTVSHDLTRIEPGVFKGPEFKAGHRIQARDLCRLQQMGRFHVAVAENFDLPVDMLHEDEAAELFAKRMAGPGVSYSLPPHEGKIDFVAEQAGLFTVDVARMKQFNMVTNVMCASRHDASIVSSGTRLAGTRIIPLYISRDTMGEALSILGTEPLFTVQPMRKGKMGVLVTGTEIFQGIIQDKFIPVMEAKAKQYGCELVKAIIVPDSVEEIGAAIEAIRDAGADILVTTGGLSVDPDDVTRSALMEAGLTNVIHGVPVLPGTMSVVGELPGRVLAHTAKDIAQGTCTKADQENSTEVCKEPSREDAKTSAGHDGTTIQVIGVPACALYFKTTFFDLVFPRLLAGRTVTREEIASLGVGGYCLSCRICTYPKCSFGK